MSVPWTPVPGEILLFSGHMIDHENAESARFPPEAEGVAAAAIAAVLDRLKVAAGDLGLTEGACGGDILFAEALLARGASLELRLPLPESDFVTRSVGYPKKTPPPDTWVKRFNVLKHHNRVTVREMSPGWGDATSIDPFERCNLWMLRDALAVGADRLHFICLWDGERGKGLGGTADMKQKVDAAGAKVEWIDTRLLWKS